MTGKRAIIVGAPGAGKSEAKKLLADSYEHWDQVRFYGHPNPNPLYHDGIAIGHLSDYRKELEIATDRVKYITLSQTSSGHKDVYFTHSLVDSVAYPTVRLFHMVNSGSVNDDELFRWEMVLHINAMMMRDTTPLIPVVFLRGNDGESFSQDIEKALESILNDWKIAHTELTYPKEVATMLLKLEKEDDGITASNVEEEPAQYNDNF